MKVTFFRSRSNASAELAAMLQQALVSGAVRGLVIEVRVLQDGTQTDMLRACLGEDVVVFDGSVEDDAGSNYAAATAQPMAMDHVLVISRTHLPLNFYGLREGGSPNSGGAADGRIALGNEELLHWLLLQIDDLANHIRPPEETLVLEPGASMLQAASAITSASEAIMRRSLDIQRERRRHSVFVSYLSKCSQENSDQDRLVGQHVEDLIKQLPALMHQRDLTTKYFPPGSLSSEFMTEQRRWQVLSIIDRYIRTAGDFLIFDSPDYLQSWWTQAELVMVGYNRGLNGNDGPRVIRYCPRWEQENDAVAAHVLAPSFEEVDPKWVPLLAESERREMTRFLSNADPGTCGFESAKAMGSLSNLPEPLLWLAFKGQRWALESLGVMSQGSVLTKVSERTTFEDFKQSVNSHAYKESFWNDRIVTCQRCRSLRGVHFDAERFISSSNPGMYRVREEELDRALQRGEWACENGHRFRVHEDKIPHLQWWPVRTGRTTGPGGAYIESVPRYQLDEMK